MSGLHHDIHIESFRTLSTLHQTDKERSLIYLGQYLPRSVRENQAIPHASTRPRNSSFRETLTDIH